MPNSATERFSRTYTPRVPDDSYDSLGTAADSLVSVPAEKPFESIKLSQGFFNGVLAQVLVTAGQTAGLKLTNSFKNGVLQQTLIPTPTQHDTLTVSTVMAGGTLA